MHKLDSMLTTKSETSKEVSTFFTTETPNPDSTDRLNVVMIIIIIIILAGIVLFPSIIYGIVGLLILAITCMCRMRKTNHLPPVEESYM